MKVKNILVIILFLGPICFASGFEILIGAELGYMPINRTWGIQGNNEMFSNNQPMQVTSFETGLFWRDLVFIGGAITCYAIPPWEKNKTGYSFNPTQLKSDFKTGIIPFEGITISFEHMCTHPIDTTRLGRNNRVNEGYNYISIEYKKRFPIR